MVENPIEVQECEIPHLKGLICGCLEPTNLSRMACGLTRAVGARGHRGMCPPYTPIPSPT